MGCSFFYSTLVSTSNNNRRNSWKTGTSITEIAETSKDSNMFLLEQMLGKVNA